MYTYVSVIIFLLSTIVRDKLQCLSNVAARYVSDTRKSDRSLRQLMHVDLHWVDVPERVKFKALSLYQ